VDKIDIKGFFSGQPIDIDMRRMEQSLTDGAANPDEFLGELQGYYIKVRGKRLRPVLAFAPWYLRHPGVKVPDAVARAGAVVELLHTGSLYVSRDATKIRVNSSASRLRFAHDRVGAMPLSISSSSQ
jgi:hypothetical protein